MVVGSNDTGGISTSHGGMVLIVVNDARISRLQHFVLEQVGYRVVCAGTGAEALEILPTPLLRWSSWTRCSPRWTDLQRVERSVSVLRCR